MNALHGTALCLLLCCGSVQADDLLGLRNPADLPAAAYAYGNALLASTFMPLKDATSDQWSRYAPRDGINLDIVAVQLGAGFSWGGVSWGVVQRQDWLGQAQRETLDAYRAQQMGLALPPGRSYALDYALRGMEAYGLSAAKALRIEGEQHVLQIGTRVSILQGTRVKNQSANGQATALAPSGLSVQGNTSNADSQLDTVANSFNPSQQRGTPDGSGYSVDLGLLYRNANGLELEWTIADALSEMHWTAIPEMTLSGSSTFNGVFPGGYKLRRDFTEALPIKQALRVSVPIGSDRLELSDSILGEFHFPGLGWRHTLQSGSEWGVDYDLVFQTWGLHWSHGANRLNLRMDNPDPDKARAMSLSLAWQI